MPHFSRNTEIKCNLTLLCTFSEKSCGPRKQHEMVWVVSTKTQEDLTHSRDVKRGPPDSNVTFRYASTVPFTILGGITIQWKRNLLEFIRFSGVLNSHPGEHFSVEKNVYPTVLTGSDVFQYFLPLPFSLLPILIDTLDSLDRKVSKICVCFLLTSSLSPSALRLLPGPNEVATESLPWGSQRGIRHKPLPSGCVSASTGPWLLEGSPSLVL